MYDQVFRPLFTGKFKETPILHVHVRIWLSPVFIFGLHSQLKCEQLQPRRLDQHRRHCALVATGDPTFSNEYGVNRLSILNEVPLFDLCVCIPHDIMHVLLEGVLPRHCKMLLRYYIVDQRLFTVKYLNQQIKAFKYGYSEKAGAPRQIDGERLTSDDTKFVQSGKCDYV